MFNKNLDCFPFKYVFVFSIHELDFFIVNSYYGFTLCHRIRPTTYTYTIPLPYLLIGRMWGFNTWVIRGSILVIVNILNKMF